MNGRQLEWVLSAVLVIAAAFLAFAPFHPDPDGLELSAQARAVPPVNGQSQHVEVTVRWHWTGRPGKRGDTIAFGFDRSNWLMLHNGGGYTDPSPLIARHGEMWSIWRLPVDGRMDGELTETFAVRQWRPEVYQYTTLPLRFYYVHEPSRGHTGWAKLLDSRLSFR